MYSRKEQKIIRHTREKIFDLFKKFTAREHGFEHTKRVRDWILKIAKDEGADMFLSEMAAWLHDIGRTKESSVSITGWGHNDWSYEMCRQWFKNDEIFFDLTRRQKLVILYCVKYHWNNAANKYAEAGILRDADKLDLFGRQGVARLIKLFGDDEIKLSASLRLIFDCYYWFKTKTAKQIMREKKMLKPIKYYYIKFLKNKIVSVKL